MRIALHFRVDSSTGSPLHRAFDEIARAMRMRPRILLNTKVFVGDLLLTRLASELKDPGSSWTSKLQRVIAAWLAPTSPTWARPWSRLDPDIASIAAETTFIVFCFDSMDATDAELLDRRLVNQPAYVGALEIDDTSPLHWHLYSLLPWVRISGDRAFQLWDGLNADDKDPELLEALRNWGFTNASYEALNGRYTIFDAYTNLEHARRVYLWRRRFGSMLAFAAENAVSRIGDAAPELSEMLFAALDTFERAETQEHYSQVATTCRRVFEYVVDQLCPPKTEPLHGRDLGLGKHRNRVRAFAEAERVSASDRDLVLASLDVWADQVKRLGELANKGVHADISRAESRRCMIRTVLLLDDLASFRIAPFEHKGHIDASLLESFVQRRGGDSA